MLTKTGELLMRKKNEAPTQPQPRPSSTHHAKPNQPLSSPLRMLGHISHNIQYNFISVSNKSSLELQVSKEVLQQLQVQNFRLIEQNMRLVEWCKAFLSKTRQNIMRVIQGIQQFRYLDSVNKLYEVVGELTQYEQSGFQVSRSAAKEHYLHLQRLSHPQTNSIHSQLEMRRMQAFKYDPKENKQEKAIQGLKIEEQPMEKAASGSALIDKLKPDFSQFQPTTDEAALLNMLVMQSWVIESFIESKMK